MRLRRVLLGAAAATVLSTAFAFAAGLDESAQTLASGSHVVARCDSTPNDWTYGTYTKNADGQVTGVTVSNIAATCENGTLSLALTDGVAVATSGPTTIASCTSTVCSVAMTVSPPLYPAQIASSNALVTGP